MRCTNEDLTKERTKGPCHHLLWPVGQSMRGLAHGLVTRLRTIADTEKKRERLSECTGTAVLSTFPVASLLLLPVFHAAVDILLPSESFTARGYGDINNSLEEILVRSFSYKSPERERRMADTHFREEEE